MIALPKDESGSPSNIAPCTTGAPDGDHAALLAAIEQLVAVANHIPPRSVDDTKLRTLAKVLRKIRRPEVPRRVIASAATTDPDLAELNRRLGLVRDRVRAVALRGQPGFYLYGRPGTAKTYTVRTTLEEIGCHYEYHLGHLTHIGLFELLEENSDKVIVLDDVAPIFEKRPTVTILLAALGKQPDGTRIVKYKRQGKTVNVDFTGSIIAISNLELHGDAVTDALKSRVQTLNYNPTNEQVAALMRDIASKGYALPDEGGQLSPRECGIVTEFVLSEGNRLGLDPDIRVQVDKAFPDYVQWRDGDTETHWKDLVASSLVDRLIELKHTKVTVPTKKAEMADELKLLEKLIRDHSDPNERLEAYMKATSKSKRTCQRRMRELKTKMPPHVE